MAVLCAALAVGAASSASAATWVAQTTPGPSGPPDAALTSVSCPSAAFCMAVGTSDFGFDHLGIDLLGPIATFAERWDGSAWTVLPTPTAGPSPALVSLSCVRVDDCYAAGQYDPHTLTPPSSQQPLLEYWGSDRCSRVAIPPVATLPNRTWFEGNLLDPNLFGISCVLQSGCTAVGAQPQGANSTPLAITDLPRPAN